MESIVVNLDALWHEHLILHVVLMAISTMAILAAMLVDGISGVMKARARGVARTSVGYKKTADKARKYFTPYLTLVCIDVLTSVIVPFPAFSMLWAAYCIFCEFVSVREKAWQKAELQQAEKTMSVVIENKEDIARLVAKLLFQQSTEKDATNLNISSSSFDKHDK